MFTHTLATVIMALSSLLITTAAPIDDATSVPALEFTTSFPEYFCANSVQTLYWRGGSGVYDVQARLHLQGYPEENDKVGRLSTTRSEDRVRISRSELYPDTALTQPGLDHLRGPELHRSLQVHLSHWQNRQRIPRRINLVSPIPILDEVGANVSSVFTVNDAAGEVEAASTAAIPIYNC